MKYKKPNKPKSKSLNFILPLAVYPFEIMFSFGQTDEELFKVLRKNGIEDADDLEKTRMNGMGRFCMFGNNSSLVRLYTYPEYPADYGTLSHEIFHAVTHVLDRIGMKLELDVSDEAYSYLMGYITTEVYKKISE